MRRTKIVCSIGPATGTTEALASLVEAGMDVARFNCSHGDWNTRRPLIRYLMSLSDRGGGRPAVLVDLAGPKFRLGKVEGDQMELKQGTRLRLAMRPAPGEIEFPLPEVIECAGPGDTILVGDGGVSLRVESKQSDTLDAVVLDEGIIRTRQGITLVGRDIPVPAVTPQDAFDIRCAADEGVDWVGVSFVRSAGDIETARKMARDAGSHAGIVAKIETFQAIERLDEILHEADGVMIARGDLGLQLPLEEVPHLQKRIIHHARQAGKPVITATQMLESMIENERPTRAEVSDVAGAILDGTDAVMLSGETAIGKYPLRTVQTMARIVGRAERGAPYLAELLPKGEADSTAAVARAACTLASALGAAAIIGFTRSGTTARMLARNRPKAPILAASPDPATLGRLRLVWGVVPMYAEQAHTIDDMIAAAYRSGLRGGYIRVGDRVVITLGTPGKDSGYTNLIYFGEVTENGKEA